MKIDSALLASGKASKQLERLAASVKRTEQAERVRAAITSKWALLITGAYGKTETAAEQAGAEIDRLKRKQEEASRGAERASTVWSGLSKPLQRLSTGGLEKLVRMSDTLAGAGARLELVVDDGGSVRELEQKIYQLAIRSRTLYTDALGDIISLSSRAGDSFTGNDDMLRYYELMSKNLRIGGGGAKEQDAAMGAATEAMATGRLDSSGAQTLFANAPLLEAAVENHMKKVAQAEGSMAEWAAAGMLTANVIKAALDESAGAVEARFSQLPMTWGDVWTQMQTVATKALGPVLGVINWLANNLAIILPLILAVGGAFAVFQLAAKWADIAAFATGAYKTALVFLSAGYMFLTGNAAEATKALATVNATLAANPALIVVMGILLLIGIIYAAVSAFNKLTGASVSAVGIIGGIFAVLGAFLINTFFLPVFNLFAAVANFIGNVFRDPVSAVKIMFCDLALSALSYIQKMAQGIETLINKLPGVDVHITGFIDDIYNGLKAKTDALKDESGWVEYFQPWEYIDYSDAANAGYKLGEKVQDKIGGLFGGGAAGMGLDWGPDPELGLDAMGDDVKATAQNTGAMAREVNIADEDLQLMKDVAEMRYVQNFVTLTPTVSMNAQISERVDKEEVIHAIALALEDEVASSAEMVYA